MRRERRREDDDSLVKSAVTRPPEYYMARLHLSSPLREIIRELRCIPAGIIFRHLAETSHYPSRSENPVTSSATAPTSSNRSSRLATIVRETTGESCRDS